MSTTTTVKRARVTARIAQAENVNLPTSSENTQILVNQTEEKRKQLDKKCGEYEQICRKLAKFRNELTTLENEKHNLLAQLDEFDEEDRKLKKQEESSYIAQQQKNNDMREIERKWNVESEKEDKLRNALEHEMVVEKELVEKCSIVASKVDQLGDLADSDEKELKRLENAFEVDMKTEKTLEQYLTRLVDDVFMNQRRLEDIHIGTSRGRANFRQTEKILREQKRRHRRTTIEQDDDNHIFHTNVNDSEERVKLKKMEMEWKELERIIREKEVELIGLTEKVNEKLRKHEEEEMSNVNEMEREKQEDIVEKLSDLKLQTPMYAAYNASVDFSTMEKLELPKINHSSNIRTSATSSLKSVEFSDDLNDLNDYHEMIENRKRILKSSESEAIRMISDELRQLEVFVSGQRQQAQALDNNIKALNENIKSRQNDVKFFERKIEEFMEKARNEILQKRIQEEMEEKPKDRPNIDLKRDIQNFVNERIVLENEKTGLMNKLKDSNIECNKLEEQWKIMKGFSKSVDLEAVQKLGTEVEMWRTKVDNLSDEINKLRKMENYASLANGQLRNNLALLKPYDEEYQEFENLVEANKRLNDQLAKHEFRKSCEDLIQRGDIRVVQ